MASEINVKHQAAHQAASYCDHCGTINPPSRCGKCKLIRYCSRECQEEGWRLHKTACPVIREFAAAVVPPPASVGPISAFLMEGDEITSLTQERFSQLSGGYLYNEKAVLTPATIVKAKKDNNQDEFLKALEYVSPSQPKPQTVALKNDGLFGLSLVSTEEIRPGEIICYFGGEILFENIPTYRNALYKLADNDQNKFAGLGIYVNDGFPNASFSQIGSHSQKTLLALDTIEPGEAIYLHYGNTHNVKTGRYFISPPSYEKMKEFCQGLKKHMQLFQMPGAELVHRSIAEKINYIFQTPYALAKLLLDQVLDPEEAYEHLLIVRKKAAREHGFDQLDLGFCMAMLTIMDAGPAAVAATKSLMDEVTVNAFMCVTAKYLYEEPEISVKLIEEFTIFGKLVDQIYLQMNGTTQGTYFNTLDLFPDLPFDESAFIKEYQCLSSKRKKLMLPYIQGSIQYMDDNTPTINLAPGQEHPLSRLKNILKKCEIS